MSRPLNAKYYARKKIERHEFNDSRTEEYECGADSLEELESIYIMLHESDSAEVKHEFE
jgi:hypothetical protein